MALSLGLGLGLAFGGGVDAPTEPLTAAERVLYTASAVFDLGDVGNPTAGVGLFERLGVSADLNFGDIS